MPEITSLRGSCCQMNQFHDVTALWLGLGKVQVEREKEAEAEGDIVVWVNMMTLVQLGTFVIMETGLGNDRG